MSDRMSEYMSDRIRHFSIHSHYCNGSTMYLSMCFCICPCLHSPCRITSPIFFRVSSTLNHDKSDPYQYSANNLFFADWHPDKNVPMAFFRQRKTQSLIVTSFTLSHHGSAGSSSNSFMRKW
jgi:hypothetical protein